MALTQIYWHCPLNQLFKERKTILSVRTKKTKTYRLPPWILANTRLALRRKADLAKTVEDLDSR